MTRGLLMMAAWAALSHWRTRTARMEGGTLMRTLRLSLVGTVIVVLSGWPVAVVGQEPEPSDPMAPVGASIRIIIDDFRYGELQQDDAGVLHELGRHMDMTWMSSDERLSGAVTYDGNRDIFDDDVDGGLAVGMHTYVVQNAGGRWVGQSPGWQLPGDTGGVQAAGDVILLQGEGDYEGLSAIVHTDWTQQPFVSDAVIFPGEIPPAPEPPAE